MLGPFSMILVTFSDDTEANGLEKAGRCLTDLLQFLSC